MRTVNGKPIRTRGTNEFRPSRKPLNLDMVETRKTSTTALAAEAGIYFDCCEGIEETEETHVIPRRSLTRQQHLAIFPQTVQTEDVITHQTDKITGQRVAVSNPKIVWRSDKTLLRRETPFRLEDMNDFKTGVKRRTSRSKRVIREPEYPATIEIPTDSDDL